jgi:hypothetical protein
VDTLPCKLTLNYNCIQYGADSIEIADTVSTVVYAEGNMDKDPLFADTSQADFHLMVASPAIGAGRDSIQVEGNWIVSPPFDMEGNPRPNPNGSKPDLGAYENTNAWPVGVTEHGQDNPGEFEIRTCPNPFLDQIAFEFSLTEQSLVTLEIFNQLGACIQVIRFPNREPGAHQVIWNPIQPGNHLYFYRIRMESVSNRVINRTGRILRIE